VDETGTLKGVRRETNRKSYTKGESNLHSRQITWPKSVRKGYREKRYQKYSGKKKFDTRLKKKAGKMA